ncbi:hypothetical protein CerSpe_234830 [Prunus speciosa]
MDMYMIIKTDKELYAELFVKWYEDAEVLHMVKKRVVKAISMMDIDNVNNGVADTPKQKLKWFENPEILQIFKKMFGPSLYEDVMPDPTSFLSRCPKGFETDLRLVRWGEDSDIHDMVHKRMFEPPLNEDGKPEGITFSSYFPECYGTYLQEAWPMVKSALEEYDISCILNLVFHYITIKTTRTTDPDIIVKAKQLVELLSIHIPVHEAIRVLSDIQWDIIKIGLGGGLRSKYGIRLDQGVEREKLLMRPLNILGGLTTCNVFFRKDNIAVMGSPMGLKLIRRIVVDCIVHNVDPASRVNRISKFMSFQVRKNLEDLHL